MSANLKPGHYEDAEGRYWELDQDGRWFDERADPRFEPKRPVYRLVREPLVSEVQGETKAVLMPDVEQAVYAAAYDAATSALQMLANAIEPGDTAFKVKYEYIPDFLEALKAEHATRQKP